MDAVERRPHDIDIAVLVPHSPIRVYTMGEKAIRREPANAEERATMRKLVREALDVGALGFGTSRMAAHRSSKGELIPSFEAEEIELCEIADEMRQAGKGVFQIVPNTGFASYESQLPIMERIAAATGRTLTYTHAQFGDWRKGLNLLEEANAKPGVDIKAQLLPRPVGMMLGLTLSAHSFCTTPTYLRIKHLPLPELVAEMKKPEVRQAILTETPENPTNPLITFTRRYERIFPVSGPINYEPAAEQSFAGLAKAKQGWTAAELAYDNLLEDDGKAMQMLTIANYEDCNLDWCETLFESDSVVLGLGDGGAHYGMICDASYTTFALSHWTRDRSGGKRSVEDMVHRLTREPAELMGLLDRGLVAPGHRANLNVIDYDKLSVRNPHMVADLPAGGKRLHQEAKGYVATIVNGAVIVDNDRPTDARPGKLVRGAQQPR
jgi:N-acyl-D-aspartate/D-glutamate deacylase